ncbi:hypothetical protein KL905_004882 [Ogataea polymorpha]|nr:hypothetical protein KL905_004882 [Ogataea polymorpha]KAG7930442.1 hypothetical protein KL934_004841 [Ogataea polymorpha]
MTIFVTKHSNSYIERKTTGLEQVLQSVKELQDHLFHLHASPESYYKEDFDARAEVRRSHFAAHKEAGGTLLPIGGDARSKHYLPQFWLLLPRPPVGVITGCLSTAKTDRQASWHSHGAAGGGACLRDHLEDGLQLAIHRSTALL